MIKKAGERRRAYIQLQSEFKELENDDALQSHNEIVQKGKWKNRHN